MKKQIATIVLSSTLLLSGCANWCDECADGSCDVVTTKTELAADTLFAFDSAKLSASADAALTPIVERLKADSTEKVRIAGYTDSTGSEAYNMKLSERRANAVAAYFEAHGISCDRIETRGFGESHPVASNATAAGRQQNRRAVVVTVQ